MKNLFKEPYIEILKLSVIDVIATSGTTGTTGMGVQGLSGVTGYANDDNLYARCGGKKKRKKCSVGGVIGKDNYNTIIDGIIGRTR